MNSSAVLPPAGDIDAVLNECPIKEDHEFSGFFRRRHDAEPDQGWDLLQSLYSFNFRPADAAEPFGPQSVIGDRRSMIPSDLTDEQLVALASTLDQIGDPEYRARILDVLWLRRRDPTAARAAVDAYLQSGSRLEDPEHWVQSLHRYERALRLASQVEVKGELPKKVLRHLEARVLHYDGSDSLYFTAKSLELLADFAFGDLRPLAEIAGRVAQASRSVGNFDRARTYFAVQARLLKAAKDPAAAETARVERAECLSEEAEVRQRAGAAIAHITSCSKP
jgi:tetratricopeptide (TPR) repeat protein